MLRELKTFYIKCHYCDNELTFIDTEERIPLGWTVDKDETQSWIIYYYHRCPECRPKDIQVNNFNKHLDAMVEFLLKQHNKNQAIDYINFTLHNTVDEAIKIYKGK